MSARLHLAKPEDLDRLLPMVAAFHQEQGIARSDEQRQTSIQPLLEGLPHGAVYLIGPRKAPVGYLVVSFGYSLELGGIDCFLDEFYVRPAVRRRGMGSEALHALLVTLSGAGVAAMHLEVLRGEGTAQGLYAKFGFQVRDQYNLMTRHLQE